MFSRAKAEVKLLLLSCRGVYGVSQAVKVKKTPDQRERLKAGELLAKRYGILSEQSQIRWGCSGRDDWWK